MYLMDLVQLIRAREQRSQGHDLKHDTAHTPHVHLVSVVAISEQTLRSSVPPGGYVLCVGLLRVNTLTRTKVCQLQHVLLKQSHTINIRIHTQCTYVIPRAFEGGGGG